MWYASISIWTHIWKHLEDLSGDGKDTTGVHLISQLCSCRSVPLGGEQKGRSITAARQRHPSGKHQGKVRDRLKYRNQQQALLLYVLLYYKYVLYVIYVYNFYAWIACKLQGSEWDIINLDFHISPDVTEQCLLEVAGLLFVLLPPTHLQVSPPLEQLWGFHPGRQTETYVE